jgi:peptide/nickel transport system substrate-binding protein
MATLGATEAVAGDDVIRYGVSSSPSNPWAHYRTSCDTSCSLIFGAITDTLFATSTDGEVVGLLIETFDTNADQTVHTWRLRDGISFSDGSALDAAAVKVNVDACRFSLLTGPGLAGIDDVRADGLTLTITSLAPWATLPAHFAETPCGHMFSAPWLASLPDLPQRSADAPFFDAVIAAELPSGDPTRPVGLGPFTMVSFAPGNGNSTLIERNPTYWRGPNGVTGEALPRLDEIELVVIADDATRQTALETGQFDMIHFREPDSAGPAAPADVATVTSAAFADTAHVVLNTADIEGNPLRHISCRRAVVRSIDVATLTEVLGQPAPAVGPFPPGVLGHDPERLVNAFDPLAAAQWAQRCAEDSAVEDRAAEDGATGGPIPLRLMTATGDPRAATVAEMVERAPSGSESGAIAVEIVELDAAGLGLAALLGDFDLLIWDNHAGVHPDLAFPWWYSEASAAIGSVATNIGRLDDPALDRALVRLRRSQNSEAVARNAVEVQRAFDANAAFAWLYWTTWTVAADRSIDLDLSRSTPEGIDLVPMINGAHDLATVGSR